MITYRRPILVATATASLLLATACGSDGQPAPADPALPAGAAPAAGAVFPMTIENCGRQLTIDAKPEKVLTIGTSAVTLLDAAGAADRIAARTAEFDTPIPGDAGKAVADVPILTPDDPTAEVVIGSGTDLAIGYGLYSTTAEDLEAAGIPTIFSAATCGQSGVPFGQLDGVTFDDIYTDIELFGKLFDTQQQADKAVTELRERVTAVEDGPMPTELHTAAGLWFSENTPYAIGKQHLLTATMGTVGLENVFGDLNKMTAEVSVEELVDRNPDVLILTYGYTADETFEGAKAKLLANPALAGLSAVQNDRVLGLFYGEAEPQPGAVAGLEKVAADLAALSS